MLECRKCGQRGPTICELQHSKKAYDDCVKLSLFGCFLGCCLAPFYMEKYKDAYHACGTCGRDIALKKAYEDYDNHNQSKKK